MADSGVDLVFDDHLNEHYPRTQVLMAQPQSSPSGMTPASKPRVHRIRQLRSTQKNELAKQQYEQSLRRQNNNSSSNNNNNNSSTTSFAGSSRPLPVIQAERMGLDEQDVADITGHTAPARYSIHTVGSVGGNVSSSVSDASALVNQLWPNSAPDTLSFELVHVPGSAATSYSELDEQLDDIESIVASVDEFGTPTSYISESSLQDGGSYRGGRRKEPPPPNMTPEQRQLWEMERQKKDNHNNIEKRRRYKINECIQELGNMLPSSYNCDYKETVNSKGAILQATVEYIQRLRDDQKQMTQLKAQVEQLEQNQRRLLLQREALKAAVVAAHSQSAPQQQQHSPHHPTTTTLPAQLTNHHHQQQQQQLLLSSSLQQHQGGVSGLVHSNSLPVTLQHSSQHSAVNSHVLNNDCFMLPVVDTEEVGMDVMSFMYEDGMTGLQQDFMEANMD